MRTRFVTPWLLVLAWMLAASFCLPEYASAQEADYDDDTGLDFVWTPPEGSFDHYNIYVSVDGIQYQLDGTSSTEAYTLAGQNGHNYTIKVSAVTSGGTEGPFSPESDPVICDTVAPLIPTISQTYDVLDQNTIVLSIESGPTDMNFSNYQLLGGQYADWTDTSETTSFVFSVDADSHNVVEVREKDLAGNVGPEASVTVENLSGDNDSDGIPNYWEYMYREILDAQNPADANVDSDGDGWSNYEEFLAGTDPTDMSMPPVPEMVMADDMLTLNWVPFGTGSYTVEWVADLVDGTWQSVLGVDWPSAGNSWSSAIPDATCFYRIKSGTVCTVPVGVVAADAHRDGLTMISIPLLTADHRLNGEPGCIGDMIKKNLHGGGSAAEADMIWKWDAGMQDYSLAFLVDLPGSPFHGKWFDPEIGDQSSMTLKLGEAIWIERKTTGGPTERISFGGLVPMDMGITVPLVQGANMISNPYPTHLALNDSTLADVAMAGPCLAAADTVFAWDPAQRKYHCAFLVDSPGSPYHGKWFDPDTGGESTIAFEPGKAVWFMRTVATPATWLCERRFSR